ncbi:hypothetical protein [Clostridium sp. AM58-1XD]|uniref:hypothetical protein n=1 Tax=Clostridium sp. AM58-1XD TaxID=2292307 RepID=UPI000E5565D4|nr:hypothetical protein [Clostridium sp. AM58-1XD]RGY99048.1 hypothetical protein DXA13_08975 [Clostridium sp. AM58-1XD]
MKRKVCPICDKAMKVPFYCGTCKRIVLHPYEQDATYYLNERHPSSEADCSYHNGRQNEAESGRWDDILKIPEKDIREYQEPAERLIQWMKYKNRWVLVLIGAYLIFVVVSGISVIGSLKDQSERSWPADYLQTEAVLEIEEETEEFYHEWELSDEDVISAGEACSAYGHLPVMIDQLKPVFLYYLMSEEYRVSSDDPWSYNLTYDNLTSYNTLINCAVYDDEDRQIGSIGILYDTATSQLHEIDISAKDRETLINIMKDAVFSLEDTGVIPKTMEFPQKLENGLDPEAPENGGSIPAEYDLDAENVTIQCRIDNEQGIWNYQGTIAAKPGNEM